MTSVDLICSGDTIYEMGMTVTGFRIANQWPVYCNRKIWHTPQFSLYIVVPTLPIISSHRLIPSGSAPPCVLPETLYFLCTVWTSTNEYRVGDLFVRWWRNGTLDRGTHFVHFVRCEVLDLWCTLLQLLHYSFLLVVFSLRPLETRFPHLLGSLRLQPALVHLRTLLSSLHSLHFEVLTWPPDNNKSFIFLSLWISACEHHTLRSHLLLSLYFYVWSPPNYKTHASSTLYIDMPFAPIQNQVSFQSLEPLYALV